MVDRCSFEWAKHGQNQRDDLEVSVPVKQGTPARTKCKIRKRTRGCPSCWTVVPAWDVHLAVRVGSDVREWTRLCLDFSQPACSTRISLPLCSPEQIHVAPPCHTDSVTCCFYYIIWRARRDSNARPLASDLIPRRKRW